MGIILPEEHIITNIKLDGSYYKEIDQIIESMFNKSRFN